MSYFVLLYRKIKCFCAVKIFMLTVLIFFAYNAIIFIDEEKVSWDTMLWSFFFAF